MAKKFARTAILERLRNEIAASRSLLAVGCGNGLVARCAESGGADLLVVYNSGQFRMNGLPSFVANMPVGNANDIMLDLGRRSIMPGKRTAPVVGGIFASDPTRQIDEVFDEMERIGYSGVINFPTVGGLDGRYRRNIESLGLGFDLEVAMVKEARARDFFTMAYVYDPEQTEKMVSAGVDVIVGHMGFTTGGDIGAKHPFAFTEAVDALKAIFERALAVRGDVILLSHGGPIETAEDAEKVNLQTKAMGFVAASSFERIPIERALRAACDQFKTIQVS